MKKYITLVLLLISTLSFSQMRNYNIKVVAMHPGNYTRTYDVAVFTPMNYDSTKTYHSDFFLHGYGERGTDINKVYATGYPWALKNGVTVDRLIFVPQNHYGGYDGFFPGIVAAIEARYKITSFAVCGLSGGGGNVWEAINGVSATFSAKWRAAEALSPSSFTAINMGWIANSKTKFLSRAGTQSGDAGYIGNAISAHNSISAIAPGRSRLITKDGIGHGGSFTEPYRDTVFLNFMKPDTSTIPPVVIVAPPPSVATTVFTVAQLRTIDSIITSRSTPVELPLKVEKDSLGRNSLGSYKATDFQDGYMSKELVNKLNSLELQINALKTRQSSYDSLIDQLIILLSTYKK